jgi:hypothetical protein
LLILHLPLLLKQNLKNLLYSMLMEMKY